MKLPPPLLCLAAALLPAILPRATAADRPNLVYLLADDIGETKDVTAEHPDMLAKMEKLLDESRTESPEFPLKGRKVKKGNP